MIKKFVTGVEIAGSDQKGNEITSVFPGKYNTLKVVKFVDFGVYLDGGEMGEILLPARYVPETCEVDDDLEVFIYHDSEDRIIATTEKPYAQVGEFAMLRDKIPLAPNAVVGDLTQHFNQGFGTRLLVHFTPPRSNPFHVP